MAHVESCALGQKTLEETRMFLYVYIYMATYTQLYDPKP